MRRREFIQIAGIMAGGLVHSRALTSILDGKNQHLLLAPDFIDQAVNEFSKRQRTLVTELVDVIIPQCEKYPGALAAGVPKFVELMVAHWMTDAERDAFKLGLVEVDQLAQETLGSDFASCSADQRITVLEALEAKYQDHPWYQPGRLVSQDDNAATLPFIAQLKEFTVFGFFMSEVGCKQVLRYNPMPGTFDADIPLGQDESSWTPTPLM